MNTDSMSSAGSFASEFETLVKKQVDSIKLGNIVTGTVVNIGKEMVTIDIGFKSEGVVPTQQFQGIDGKIDVKVGDETEVFILQLDLYHHIQSIQLFFRPLRHIQYTLQFRYHCN